MSKKEYKRGVCNRCGRILEDKKKYLCDECRELNRKESNKKSYEKVKERVAKGLCRYCEKPALPGFQFCDYHYKQRQKFYAKHRKKKTPKQKEEKITKEYKKEHGICLICGNPVDNEFYYWCDACRKNLSEKIKAQRPITKTKKDISNQQKQRYHSRKEQGLCVCCGKPATHGIYCYDHYIKNKRAWLIKKTKLQAEARLKWENGICKHCGGKIEEGSDKKWCKKCCDEVSEIMRERHRQGIYKNSRKIWSRQDTLIYQHQPKKKEVVKA